MPRRSQAPPSSSPASIRAPGFGSGTGGIGSSRTARQSPNSVQAVAAI